MNDFNWSVLADIHAAGASPAALPPSLTTAIIDRLSDAIIAPRPNALEALHDDLKRFFASLTLKAPKSIWGAIVGDTDAPPEFSAAFALGTLAFAQQIAGQVALHRAQNECIDVITSHRNKPCLQALFARNLTETELAETTGENPETIRHALTELTALGIVETLENDGSAVIALTANGHTAYRGLIHNRLLFSGIESARAMAQQFIPPPEADPDSDELDGNTDAFRKLKLVDYTAAVDSGVVFG